MARLRNAARAIFGPLGYFQMRRPSYYRPPRKQFRGVLVFAASMFKILDSNCCMPMAFIGGGGQVVG